MTAEDAGPAPQADPRAPDAIRLRQSRRTLFRALVGEVSAVLRVEEGEKSVRAGPLAWTAGQGFLTLLPAGFAMDIENRPAAGGRYRATALLLPEDLPAPRGPFLGGARAVPGALAAFDRALALHRTLAPPAIRRHAAAEVLLWLAEAGITLPPPRERLADRLRRLVAADLSHDWTAAQVARALALSEASLRRHLAAEGESFAGLLAEARLARALGLLQSTDLPVATIAADVGYASASRFARRFRLRFGLPPASIRRGDRNGAGIDRDGATLATAAE